VVVSFAGGFLNSKETLPIEELLKARVSILLFAVLGVLVAPLVEETIFRGFLYPVIARRLGIAAGIAITGTLFGLMHAAQLWGGWGQIALLILVAWCLRGCGRGPAPWRPAILCILGTMVCSLWAI
jgi:membrane protease YdiL (CAAX protease family)